MTTNNKLYIIIGCIVGLVLLLVVPTCSTYNSMITLQESTNQKWAEVQNQYQRRFDLIPNLVSTVKAYAEHESSTLQGVTNARAGIVQGDSLLAEYNRIKDSTTAPTTSSVNAMEGMERALQIYVNAVHEAYPTLQANENFLKLQDELSGTEGRVAYARKNYTESVQEYNTKVRKFPGNLVASMFGFESMPQFSADQQAQRAPDVNSLYNDK